MHHATGRLLIACLVLLAPLAARSAEPPPVEIFAAHVKFDDLRISPDGKHIAFTHEEKDNEVRLGIVTADMKTVKAQIAFGENMHMGGHYWANEERIVVRQWRNTGWLDGRSNDMQILSYDANGLDREQLFPPSPAFLSPASRLKSDPRHVLFIRQDVRDESGARLFKVNVYNGKNSYIAGAPDVSPDNRVVDLAVDGNDEVRFALELDDGANEHSTDDDQTYLHYRNAAGAWKRLNVQQARRPAAYWALGFSGDNNTFYFLSNYDMAANDTLGLFAFDFESGEIELLFRHPDVNIQGGVYGPDDEVLGVVYEPGYPAYWFIDGDNPHVKNLQSLGAAFPGQWVTINNYTWDGQMAIVEVRSDRNPGSFYLLKDRKLTHLADRFPDVDPETMGSQEAFTLVTRDGVKLYGLLTLPPGSDGQNLPMVVYPHGGPHGPYDRWGYDREVQLLATHGYAVLQVNFRGSGGYGTDFMESGYGKWGREMQDDLTDATLWAINEGIADRDRICISGGSYGGYATMQGVVREPDLYRCAIPVAGVYSLPMFWKKGDYRTYARSESNEFLEKYIGSDDATLRAYSPAYNVDQVKAALFIIHGSRDVRVPIDQAEFLRDQLEAIDYPFEWMVRSEGHGFTQVENRVDQYNAMLAFLDRHIGSGSQAQRTVNSD